MSFQLYYLTEKLEKRNEAFALKITNDANKPPALKTMECAGYKK